MKNIIEELYKEILNERNKEKIFAIYSEKDYEEKLSYETIVKSIISFNDKLGVNDFEKGIGILIENSIDFVIAFMAILFNGYRVIGIDPLITKEGLEKIISDNNIEYIAVNNKSRKDIIDLEKVKLIEVKKDLIKGVYDVNRLPKINSDFNKIIIISHTSGTSGKFSKGVKVSNLNVSFVSQEYNKIYNTSEKSQIITVLPLWHNYAMFACLTNAIMGKGKIIIMNKWDLENFLYINKTYKPDIFPGSPYMYIDIINADLNKIDISSLRICDSGGDSLPIECIKKFEEKTNALITEGYGLTETISLTHFNYSAKERKIGSLGKCVSNVECKITDLDEKEIGRNKWGLLWIKGPMVFNGYVNNEEQTNRVLKDGWFNTEDIVREDNDGYFYIAGRLSDMKSYKENDITLKEIENILYKFEGMNRTFIKKKYNEEADFSSYDIYAILKEGYNESKLIDYIKVNLVGIIVDNVKIVDKLPTTGTGKIKRNKLD